MFETTWIRAFYWIQRNVLQQTIQNWIADHQLRTTVNLNSQILLLHIFHFLPRYFFLIHYFPTHSHVKKCYDTSLEAVLDFSQKDIAAITHSGLTILVYVF